MVGVKYNSLEQRAAPKPTNLLWACHFFRCVGRPVLFDICFTYILNFNLLSERNKPIKVSPIPIAAIHVISSFNTRTDVTTVMTGTI